MRSQDGIPRIALRLERSDAGGSAVLFARQWGQVLVRALRNRPDSGEQLAVALVDALCNGVPGTARAGNVNARRPEGLGVRKGAVLDAMFVGSNFEAFIGHESDFRWRLDINRMWREPAARLRRGIGLDEARECRGWPDGTDLKHAVGYWRQLPGAVRFRANGVDAIEGASVIARAELETRRRERRLRERECQCAAIALAGKTEELATSGTLASLSTVDNEAQTGGRLAIRTSMDCGAPNLLLRSMQFAAPAGRERHGVP